LDEIHPSEWEVIFSHWVKRVRWVLENNGDYYHESGNPFQKHFPVPFPGRWRHDLMTAMHDGEYQGESHFQ
jgi:hypothetical protein